MRRILFILPCLLSLATAAPLPLVQGTHAALVEETAVTTTVSGYPAQPPRGKEAESLAGTAPLAILRIDWLNKEAPPEEFEVAVTEERRIITSTHRIGRTGITRTLLATPDAVFLHFLADHPGALSFRTSLTSPQEGKTTTEGRNGLIWRSSTDAGVKAYAHIVPFESDVEADGNAILLRGEGECLVIFSITPSEDPGKPVAGIWKRLAETHDPGQEHPDPVKIWHSLLSRKPVP
jgi:hypothetical protein